MNPTARQAQYRQIADGIRSEIIDGRWTPGMKLPATDKLADTWNTSYGTAHSALQRLVKEGWIERLDGTGTFIAEHTKRFICAAIYHDTDIFSDEDAGFSRALHTALVSQVGALGKATQIFIDSRPKTAQGEVLPALTEAIRLRTVQGLIAPSTNANDVASLAALRVPTAFMINPSSPHQVTFDRETHLAGAVRELARKGCRSIGLLTHIVPPDNGGPDATFEKHLVDSARREGLETRPEWLRRPPSELFRGLDRFGYHEFKAFWALDEKPEGLVVYPDIVARGVIAAVLELGVHDIPGRLKFVLHRNSPSRPLCPFPALWAVSEADRVAAELIRIVERQFAGETISPVTLDHTFEDCGPLV